jgi:hypothetical protein
MTLLNDSPMCLGLDGVGYYSGRHGMWWWHKCKVLVIWEISFIIVNIVKDLQTAFQTPGYLWPKYITLLYYDKNKSLKKMLALSLW